MSAKHIGRYPTTDDARAAVDALRGHAGRFLTVWSTRSGVVDVWAGESPAALVAILPVGTQHRLGEGVADALAEGGASVLVMVRQ